MNAARQDIAREKFALRVAARARRTSAYAARTSRIAETFAEMFFAHIPLVPPACLAGYVAINSEADPAAIMLRAFVQGHSCALPKVVTRNAPLVFLCWTPGEPLMMGTHGTYEPQTAGQVARPEVVLMPLLAFDDAGRRLGYGGGYYDRTLAALARDGNRPLAVGLAYAAQEIQCLPEDVGDERLDWIITERGARAFREMRA